MNKYPFILVLLFSSLLQLGCRKTENFQINQTAEVTFKQSALINTPTGDIKISFGSLVGDSRCPEYAACIWGGRVSVEFILDGEERVQLSLGDLTSITLIPKVSSITYKSYTIELLEADFGLPGNQGDDKKYTFKLRVRE